MPLPRVTLKSGRDKSLRQRHPWIFSGAIDRVDLAPEAGSSGAVYSADGAFLATAAWSPASQIRARVWSFDAQALVDAAYLRARVLAAVRARDALLDARHTGC